MKSQVQYVSAVAPNSGHISLAAAIVGLTSQPVPATVLIRSTMAAASPALTKNLRWRYRLRPTLRPITNALTTTASALLMFRGRNLSGQTSGGENAIFVKLRCFKSRTGRQQESCSCAFGGSRCTAARAVGLV